MAAEEVVEAEEGDEDEDDERPVAVDDRKSRGLIRRPEEREGFPEGQDDQQDAGEGEPPVALSVGP